MTDRDYYTCAILSALIKPENEGDPHGVQRLARQAYRIAGLALIARREVIQEEREVKND